MLLLTSTSDIIRVVTGTTGASINAHASWVDNASGAITPGRTNTAAITTNTTTTIVASPGASTQRNVKNISLTNNHASVSTQVTVQHYDGSNSEDLFGVYLMPGENLIMDAEGAWHHHDANGAEYAYTAPATRNMGISGTLAESMPREICPEVNTTVAASGTLFMQAISLVAGQLISNVIASSATTAAGTPTNYMFGLYDGSRNLLAQTANQTTTAWAANTIKTIALTSSYRVLTSGLYYIGYFMTATTVITMKGGTAKTGGQLAATAPILHGTSSTGLTTSLPNPAAAITGGTASIYVAVS
jgi:hypothetical protein